MVLGVIVSSLMRTKHVRSDGKILPNNVAVDVSNHIDTFTIVIRSLPGVSSEDIKKVIEKHYETVRVLHDEKTIVSK